MNDELSTAPISPLRRRLIDDMNMRRFSPVTQRNYIRDVGRFASFLGRAPWKRNFETRPVLRQPSTQSGRYF
jgi:hypothetical protein